LWPTAVLFSAVTVLSLFAMGLYDAAVVHAHGYGPASLPEC
jgi:hypothetical protein